MDIAQSFEKRAPVRVNPVLHHPQELRLGLDGSWSFKLDPADVGLTERWFDHGLFPDLVQVPGTWQGQGHGGDGKDQVWDFRFEARSLRATYHGTGWYAREFTIPEDWQGWRIWLNFGGAHPTAEVWLNGRFLGAHSAPFVPFGFEISQALRPGAPNLLVVRIHECNRDIGLAYNWFGYWSGLYRSVELCATAATYLDQVHVLPSLPGTLKIKTWMGGTAKNSLSLRIAVYETESASGHAPRKEAIVTADAPVHGELTECVLSVPAPRLWSPDTPSLYRIDVALVAGDGAVQDALSERVGILELATRGKHFLINEEPYYWRGSGDFNACPETVSPDTDRERWRKKLSTLRDYGYNYVRCQSYVPSPEYFDAADEVGLLVQTEMGMIGGWGSNDAFHIYQWPQPTPEKREALKWQWDHVVMRDVNHPSANLYCMSNEWGAATLYPRIAWQCYRETKAIKPSAFIIWTDGGYNADLPGDFVNAEADIDAKTDKPVVQHEFRWWSSYPDVRTRHKYTGAQRPYGIDLAVANASRHGIAHILPQAAEASQRLQYIEMKSKLEACRRDNTRLAGICHFNATDLSPTPQGVIDEFYEPKYADAGLWRQTFGDTVVLSSLGFDDRVHCSGDLLDVTLSVSDYAHPPFRSPVLEWRLVAGVTVLGSGELTYAHEPYVTSQAGKITIQIPPIDKPCAARLEVRLSENDRTASNQWDLWLLPHTGELVEQDATYVEKIVTFGTPTYTWLKGIKGLPALAADDLGGHRAVRVVLTERLDANLVEFARAGGSVFLAASEGLVRPFRSTFGMPYHYFFTPPAQYPTYEDGQNGTIIQDHPLLGDFPHENFADFQFFRMMAGSPAIDLEPLGLNQGDPVIRMLHSFQVGRPLGYMAECVLGAGRLILSALDLNQSWPEARYLLGQICRNALYGEPRSMLVLGEEQVARLMRATAIP